MIQTKLKVYRFYNWGLDPDTGEHQKAPPLVDEWGLLPTISLPTYTTVPLLKIHLTDWMAAIAAGADTAEICCWRIVEVVEGGWGPVVFENVKHALKPQDAAAVAEDRKSRAEQAVPGIAQHDPDCITLCAVHGTGEKCRTLHHCEVCSEGGNSP